MNIEYQRDYWKLLSNDWKSLCDLQTKKIYKLKLERLMYRAKFMQMFYMYESAQDKAGWKGHRWGELFMACEEKLEELK